MSDGGKKRPQKMCWYITRTYTSINTCYGSV